MSINYRELRAAVRIEEVLRWMQWEANSGVGDQLRGPCPLCAASRAETPSPTVDRTFSVNTRRNIYRCFRCGSGGNALDLWSTYRKLSLYVAAQEIQNRLSQNKQP
jgi:hypothetical protein